MRLLPLTCGYIFSIIALWMADSTLLMFLQDITFANALWFGVGPGRLLFRLLLTAIILIAGVVHIYRRAAADHVFHVYSVISANGINGYAESDDKCQRLMEYCNKMAGCFKMSSRRKEDLAMLCQVYDIGLIAVASDTLNSKKRLSQEQQAAWDSHIEVGAEIAAAIPQISRVAPLILYHEECFDGSGYNGLIGQSIPLACRIFQVALLYDNLTHPASGKKMMICEEALNELGHFSNTVLDPEIIRVFRKLMGFKGCVEPALS
ncbi:MAG: HD domain-containing phosphohydrolase, partial [Clostridiales bacterium]